MPATPTKTGEPWVGAEEAAEYLGKTRRWISRAVAEKDFPCRKTGSDSRARLCFRLSEIDAWLDAQPGSNVPG